MSGDWFVSHQREPETQQNATQATVASAPGSASASAVARCRSCGQAIDAGDRFCRHCGRRQIVPEAWYYEPVWIFLLAFTVLGPFALPLVWKSPKMGRTAKVVASVVLVVLTVLIVYVIFKLGVVLFRQWQLLSEQLAY